MRKGTGSLQISPRRLLSLLLLHIIAALAVQQVNGFHHSPSRFAPNSNAKWITSNITTGNARYTKLHRMMSRCSSPSRYIQLKYGRKLDAKGYRSSPYAILRFISDPDGVKIQGELSKTYLCFSKKGRLIARSVGDSKQCVFQEEYQSSTSNVKLRSVVNPLWYVGFNKRGRRLYGFQHRLRRRRRRKGKTCFEFAKISNVRKHNRGNRRSKRYFRETNLELEVLRRRTSKTRNR